MTGRLGIFEMAVRASLDTLAAATGIVKRIAGSGGTAGASYTVDVLPGSYAGEYAICASAGVHGQWWNVGGFVASALTVPVWRLLLGAARLDATVRHEFRARQRVVVTFGVAR